MEEKKYMAVVSELWEIEKILTDLYGAGQKKVEEGIARIIRIKEILRNERENNADWRREDA